VIRDQSRQWEFKNGHDSAELVKPMKLRSCFVTLQTNSISSLTCIYAGVARFLPNPLNSRLGRAALLTVRSITPSSPFSSN